MSVVFSHEEGRRGCIQTVDAERDPQRCVTLHFPESFPTAGKREAANAAESSQPVAVHCPQRDAPFEVIEIGEGVFAFSGAGALPIQMHVDADGGVRFQQAGIEAKRRLVLGRVDPLHLRVEQSEHLIANAVDLAGWAIAFIGAGRVDIRGVSVQPAMLRDGEVIGARAEPDVSGAIRPDSHRATILVNGNVGDFIKSSWVYIEREGSLADSGSGRDYWQVLAKVELALKYVVYLNDGGRAFTDFVAHVECDGQGSVAWRQSLHDNLLGELTSSCLRGRLLHNPYAVPESLALTRDGLYELYLDFAGRLAERPYCAGRAPGEPDPDCAPLAFDFSQGWHRHDYVTFSPCSRLTHAAMTAEGGLWGGKGATPHGFTVVRHEGAGIELAFKVHSDEGACRPADYAQDHAAIYHVPAGAIRRGASPRLIPRWHVDFSVCTKLRGVVRLLDEFRFVLCIKRSSAENGAKQCEFELVRPGTLYHPAYGEIDVGRAWLPLTRRGKIAVRPDGMPEGGFGDEIDEMSGEFVSQNVICIEFPFLRRMLIPGASGATDAYGPAIYEFKLEAYARGGALITVNHIQVRVA